MTDKSNVDPEWLHDQYWDEGLSAEKIAVEVGVTGQTVLNWMKRHGIPRREARQTPSDAPYKDERWLRETYAELHSVREIAAECGVTRSAIIYYMDKFGIERRGHGFHTQRALIEYINSQK